MATFTFSTPASFKFKQQSIAINELRNPQTRIMAHTDDDLRVEVLAERMAMRLNCWKASANGERPCWKPPRKWMPADIEGFIEKWTRHILNSDMAFNQHQINGNGFFLPA